MWRVRNSQATSCLQRTYNDQLMIPHELFDWACTNVPAVYFGYCSNEDVRERSSMERRFQLSRTIPGTTKLHTFVPISNSTVEVRLYSASDAFRQERVTLAKNHIPSESGMSPVYMMGIGGAWSLQWRQGSEADISASSRSLELIQISRIPQYLHRTNVTLVDPSGLVYKKESLRTVSSQ